jgi:hypothetical protein
MKLAAALLAAAVLLAACGGSSPEGEDRAKTSFGIYRKAEDQRKDAESALNRAFRDISTAANARDRVSAIAAVDRGEEAVSTIYSTLAVEVEAADAIADYGPTRDHGERLSTALHRTREGASLIDRQLDIARRDPFLDDAANLQEIRRLSSESVKVSAPAAFARRRAVRAIALKLGVEPPFDVLFDSPRRTTTPSTTG